MKESPAQVVARLAGMPARTAAWFAGLVIAVTIAVHGGNLSRPLLEGAAGKQTHTAMVARNLLRGRCTWFRPVVDDIGPPGYFVKELPAYPAAVATLYRLTGGVDERLGRALSLAAWASGALLLFAWFANTLPAMQVAAAIGWFLLAPISVVYAGAFMNDPSVVAISLGAVVAAERWRRAPSAGRAAVVGVLVSAAVLLKLHAVFWTLPALAVQVAGGRRRQPGARRRLELAASLSLGLGIAGVWYLHAASVHRTYPVPGATTSSGWVDLSLLLRSELYGIIGAQIGSMVFTWPGLGLALIGLLGRRRGWTRCERAALAWGAGVLAQSLVFGTRMFDEVARGTEYYQLPLVITAGALAGRGMVVIDAWTSARLGWTRKFVPAGVAAICMAAASQSARAALEVPESYQRLLAQCDVVREVTPPSAQLLVLADRGGTSLYYCDRKGWTFTPARPSELSRAPSALTGVRANEFGRALATVDFVYLPFPELLEGLDQLEAHLQRDWRPVPGVPDEIRLLRRNPVVVP